MLRAHRVSLMIRRALPVLLFGQWLSLGFAQQTQPDPEQMFRQLDTNRDGRITLNEGGEGSRQFVRRLLEMAGKGESDAITRDEFLRLAEQHRRGQANPGGTNAPMPGGRPAAGDAGSAGKTATTENGSSARPPEGETGDRPRGLPPLLRTLDQNRDGRLSRTELSRIGERFGAWDTNRDGQLDADELAAAEQAANNEPAAGTNGNRRGSSSGSSGRTGTSRESGESKSSGSTKNRTERRGEASIQERLTGTWRGWVVDGRGENPNAGQLEMELRIDGNRIVGRELGTRRAPERLC